MRFHRKERNDTTAKNSRRKKEPAPSQTTTRSYFLIHDEKKDIHIQRGGSRKSPAVPSHEAHERPVERPKQQPVSRPVYGRTVHAADVRARYVEPRRKPCPHGCQWGAHPKEICSGWTQAFIGADGLVKVLGHLATVKPSVSYVRRMGMAETGGRYSRKGGQGITIDVKAVIRERPMMH